jgi:hypothetical protein
VQLAEDADFEPREADLVALQSQPAGEADDASADLGRSRRPLPAAFV